MTALEQLKAKAAEQTTEVLVQSLYLLDTKGKLETHERMARAAICDAIQDREGEEFIDKLLDELEAAAA